MTGHRDGPAPARRSLHWSPARAGGGRCGVSWSFVSRVRPGVLQDLWAVARRSIAAVDVMGDDAELGRRRVEAPSVGQRAADVFQSALPMGAHAAQPDLVVPRMALVEPGLIDQVDDVVGAMA